MLHDAVPHMDPFWFQRPAGLRVLMHEVVQGWCHPGPAPAGAVWQQRRSCGALPLGCGRLTAQAAAQAVSLDRFAGDLAVILALDWLLDRCRTAINLLGDAYGVMLVDHLARHHTAPSGGPQPYSNLELT